jgi:transglutaminase-like putative cysteine protease
MIETLRRLGFACRFISGYLYDAALDGGEVGMLGSGATHAWLQVYLPGAGWRHYDPTNRITAGYDLIPVATARHPAQAVPLTGSWFGKAQDYRSL